MSDLTTLSVKIGLVDDHVLLRSALANLIDGFESTKVIFQASNGVELVDKLGTNLKPDIVILDLNMPKMNGFESAAWLLKTYPDIKVLMLTMYDSELSLIRLLQLGVRGFLKKDIHPSEMKFAITSVMQTGFYYSNHTTNKLINLFRGKDNAEFQKTAMTEQELTFLSQICSDLTYKEIANNMGLNPRSIDTLRDQLFIKLDVRSRVGLAMVAIKHGIVTI